MGRPGACRATRGYLGSRGPVKPRSLTLVDAHGHFYPCFLPETFLEAAHLNFERAARRLGVLAHQRVVLLADPGDSNTLTLLGDRLDEGRPAWTLEPTDERDSLVAHQRGLDPIVLIRGRQIVAEERVEILVFGARGGLDHGMAFEDLITGAIQAGGITILPWGFGKWTGRRAALIRETVDRVDAWNLFLGDSGARLAWTPMPALISRASRSGVWNLPGSDPLPFRGCERSVARRGVAIPGAVDGECPMTSLGGLLRSLDEQPRTFGEGLGLAEFLMCHGRLQLGSTDATG